MRIAVFTLALLMSTHVSSQQIEKMVVTAENIGSLTVPPNVSVSANQINVIAPMSKDDLVVALREIARQKDGDQLLALVGYKGDDGDIHMLTAADLRCKD